MALRWWKFIYENQPWCWIDLVVTSLPKDRYSLDHKIFSIYNELDTHRNKCIATQGDHSKPDERLKRSAGNYKTSNFLVDCGRAEPNRQKSLKHEHLVTNIPGQLNCVQVILVHSVSSRDSQVCIFTHRWKGDVTRFKSIPNLMPCNVPNLSN